MTKLLDQALKVARDLSPDAPLHILSPAERTAIERSKAEAARGEFATDDEVRIVWAKHGL